MARMNKPTKKMQINHLQDMVDKYHTGMYYLMQYIELYGLTKHYQEWVEGMATEKDLPNKLVVSDIKQEKQEDEKPS